MNCSKNIIKVGCIGCGNMGGAIMAGLKGQEEFHLMGYNRTPERIKHLDWLRSMPDMISLAKEADVILIALKPFLVENALNTIRPVLTQDKLLISVAAGISLSALRKAVDGVCPVIRTMPNTPALVGKGVTALCLEDPSLSEDNKKTAMKLFSSIGFTLELSENKFPSFSALIGAGPAYVFYCMNALLQAGVTLGFTRNDSRKMINMLFEGCAVMSKNSEMSFSDLRDQVCSPAGLTIAGINHMERTATSGNIIDSVLAADKKGREMESK